METTEAPAASEEAAATPVQPAEEPAAVSAEEIVGYANGRPAYRSDFDAAKLSLLKQYVQLYAQFGMSIESLLVGGDGRLFQLSIEAEALRRVLSTLLVEEEADRRGVRPSAEEMQAEYDAQYAAALEANGWTDESFLAYLAEQGSTLDEFKAMAMDSVDWQLTLDAVRRAVGGPVAATDEELEAYFTEHEADYIELEQVKASHILFGTSDDDLVAYMSEHADEYGSEEGSPELDEVRDQVVADVREQAARVRAELDEGADFAELAREHSTCPSASSGGDLGWFGRGSMVAAFEDAAFALEVGQMSDIVETEFGFHIILLADHRDAFDPELGDVIDQVRTDHEEEVLNERLQVWFEGVYEDAEFEILLPLVNAMWIRQEDIDLGIAAFAEVRDGGAVDEPYLSYILGSLYETKVREAQMEKASLGTDEADSPEAAARIEAVDARIVDSLTHALAEYRLAQQAISSDASIPTKIAELEAELAEATGIAAPVEEESAPE